VRFRILFQCVFVHCRHAFLKISKTRFRYQLIRLRKTARRSKHRVDEMCERSQHVTGE